MVSECMGDVSEIQENKKQNNYWYSSPALVWLPSFFKSLATGDQALSVNVKIFLPAWLYA